MSYKKGVDYSKTNNSQSFTDPKMLQIHGCKGKDEGISKEQATQRTLDAATATFEKFAGKDLSKLSVEEKTRS